jgi:hypothetical protein
MKKLSGGRVSVYFSYRPKFKADTNYIEKKMGNFAMFQCNVNRKNPRRIVQNI